MDILDKYKGFALIKPTKNRMMNVLKTWQTTKNKYIIYLNKINKNKAFKYLSKRRWIKALAIFLLVLPTLTIIVNLLFPLRVEIRYSSVVLSEDEQLMAAYLSEDDKWRLQCKLNEISAEFLNALLQKEDRYFYYHLGFNPMSIVRALFQNLTRGKRVSGASTITMQVARLIMPKQRTYWNKLLEIFHAIQLELRYSKKEILELYISKLPYGGNVEGVKAAAYLFFQKPPKLLSTSEAVALAIVPNRPNSLQLGRYNYRIQAAKNYWLKRFKEKRIFPKEIIDAALNEPIEAQRTMPPQIAPHFCRYLVQKNPNQVTIHSTIQLKYQHTAQKIVQNYIKRIEYQGISNAAVVIVKNSNRNIVAYVGSADYNNTAAQGQVDGALALRSPGSTLKPFLYAAAFDEGIITPQSVLYDVPINIDGYRPENYDLNYNESVTAEQALANSLNIPAVKLLAKVGMNKFLDILEKAELKGISSERPQLGLSLILGGCGVSLAELTNIFTSLANEGKHSPLKWTKGFSANIQPKGKVVLSPEACFMTTEILQRLKRPDLPLAFANNFNLPQIAWKTGTSYGRKDAWSIGYNKDYTIGVWVGNFDGTGSPLLSGVETATPLLFELFGILPKSNTWFKPSAKLNKRNVCAETGLVPSEYCTSLVQDWYIPTKSSNERCSHLEKVWVNDTETISYCILCKPNQKVKEKLFPNIPPELLHFYRTTNVKFISIPPHEPSCSKTTLKGTLNIITPTPRATILTEKKNKRKIILECQTDNRANLVHWFINDEFIATVKPEQEYVYYADTGYNKIKCVDNLGRKDESFFILKEY